MITKLRRNWIPIAIFVVVVSSTLIARVGVPYVWADTQTLMNAEAITSTPLSSVWYDEPSAFHRYLPIVSLLQIPLLKLFSDNPIVPTAFQAIIWGALAVVIYLLVMELTKNKFASLASALLLAFSLPSIRESFTTLQTTALVELVIVLGLYGYVRYRNTNQHRWLYLLLGCCIVGPLIKELAIIIPIVVLLTIIAERKWNKKLLIPLPFLLLHSIFPSTLPNLFLGRLVAISIFTGGVPEHYSLFSLQRLSTLYYDMPVHLILFIPPILTFLVIVSIIIYLINKDRTLRTAGTVGLVLIIGFASIFFTNIQYGDTGLAFSAIPSMLCATVAIISFKHNKLLSIWFMIAWVPFFWLYNACDTGLIAPAIPWTIITAIWLSKLPLTRQLTEKGKALFSLSGIRHSLQYSLILILLVLGFASQPLNLIAVHKTFNGTASVTKEMARQVPEDSIVITNLIHGMELKYYEDNEFELYYAYRSHMFDDAYAIHNSTVYDELVKGHNSTDIYILAGLTLKDGENHWLLTQPDKPVELQTKFQAVCRYPTPDPLKSLLPENYRPFGGPPDLEPEVEISSGLFYQEAYAEYGLYKLIRGDEIQ